MEPVIGRRFAPTRWLAMTMWLLWVRQINPTGKSPKVCPALAEKTFRFRRRANQHYDSARLTADEGRVAIVTNVAVRCGGRGCCDETNATSADGEVVWFWRPDAGAKLASSKSCRG